MAIGANLTVGDEALPPNQIWGWPAMIINETIDIEYEDMTRETNYCEWMSTFAGWNTFQVYYDKTTGILVKYMNNASISVEEGNVTWASVYELIHLSVWVIPEYPTWTVMLLAFVAITVSIDLYIRKKLKH